MISLRMRQEQDTCLRSRAPLRVTPGRLKSIRIRSCRTCILSRVERAASTNNLLIDLDGAGHIASRAVRELLECARKKKLQDLSAKQRESAVKLFLDTLRKDGRLKARVVRKVEHWMLKPRYRYEAVIYHSGTKKPQDPTPRRGLGRFLLELEAEKKVAQEKGKLRRASKGLYPVVAWLDEKARGPARAAFKQLEKQVPRHHLERLRRSVVPGRTRVWSSQMKASFDQAFETFLKELGSAVGHEVWKVLKGKIPAEARWSFLLAAAAGLLGSFVLAPRLVANSLPQQVKDISLGPWVVTSFEPGGRQPPSSPLRPKIELEVGGKVQLLPQYLTRGHLFEQKNLDTFARFVLEGRVTLSGMMGQSYSFSADSKGAWKVMWTLDVIEWVRAWNRMGDPAKP